MTPVGALRVPSELLPAPKRALKKKAKGKLAAFRPEPDQLAYLRGLKDEYNVSEVLRLGVSLYREVDAKLSKFSLELIEFARGMGLSASPGDNRAWLPAAITRLALMGLEAHRTDGGNGHAVDQGPQIAEPSPAVRRRRG